MSAFWWVTNSMLAGLIVKKVWDFSKTPYEIDCSEKIPSAPDTGQQAASLNSLPPDYVATNTTVNAAETNDKPSQLTQSLLDKIGNFFSNIF